MSCKYCSASFISVLLLTRTSIIPAVSPKRLPWGAAARRLKAAATTSEARLRGRNGRLLGRSAPPPDPALVHISYCTRIGPNLGRGRCPTARPSPCPLPCAGEGADRSGRQQGVGDESPHAGSGCGRGLCPRRAGRAGEPRSRARSCGEYFEGRALSHSPYDSTSTRLVRYDR